MIKTKIFKILVSAFISSLLLFSAMSANAAEIWSDVTYTEQWSETPDTTEQWSEAPETEQWSEVPSSNEPEPASENETSIPTIPITKTAPDKIQIAFDIAPRVENGRNLVPLRKIFEVLNAEVKWDSATQQVIAVKGTIIIKLKMGSKTAYVNNKVVQLEVPAKIWQGRTLVPLRFVSEGLGSKVNYDSVTKKVTIDNKYYFNISNKTENQQQSKQNTSKNDNYLAAYKAYLGKWNVWVPGGWTAPDPVTGISTYTKGAGGGSMTIDQDGTFVWDMKTAVYKGVWGPHPDSPGNLILKSTDGWDYTLRMVDSKNIKWYSYGIEYYGTK